MARMLVDDEIVADGLDPVLAALDDPEGGPEASDVSVEVALASAEALCLTPEELLARG